MTELSFLLDLLLNHKLSKVTKDLIAARIRDVESGLTPRQSQPQPQAIRPVQNPATAQAPSMLAIMARNPDLVPSGVPEVIPHAPEPMPVAVIAQTPATMAALASRATAIGESLAGKVDKTTGRPRKF